jgi:hypothetical protein
VEEIKLSEMPPKGSPDDTIPIHVIFFDEFRMSPNFPCE